MRQIFRRQWRAVGWMVELDDASVPDICAVSPAIFGQGHLPRSDAEIKDLARFIADAPLMYQMLAECTEGWRPTTEVKDLLARHA